MIGMNNPRTERRDVQRGKDRVLACQEHRLGKVRYGSLGMVEVPHAIRIPWHW